MKYLLVRHAKTGANGDSRAAFGSEGAPINDVGQQQAHKLHGALIELGIDIATASVAVSELQRTRQTAEAAGLKNFTVNPLLNEVNTTDPTGTNALFEAKQLPRGALVAAEALIVNPPKQAIWVTHGLVIMGLLEKLGKADPKHFIPDYCEIIEIEL